MIGRAAALAGLVVLAPVLAVIAAAVRAGSPGPVFHRARRVAPDGEFTLIKFRTMSVGAERAGPGVTAAGDARVTPVGRVLRRTKLDELPQLWNVVRGEMSLVGPRPEDPRYVDRSDPLHAIVFAARPGITGPTALAYRDEETLLASEALALARDAGREQATHDDLDRAYRERVLPRKLELDAKYLRTRSLASDFAILGRTIAGVVTNGRG